MLDLKSMLKIIFFFLKRKLFFSTIMILNIIFVIIGYISVMKVFYLYIIKLYFFNKKYLLIK